jgi:hypothetical protein
MIDRSGIDTFQKYRKRYKARPSCSRNANNEGQYHDAWLSSEAGKESMVPYLLRWTVQPYTRSCFTGYLRRMGHMMI